jgi:hypothetical protein
MTWDEYCHKKRIDSTAFRGAEPIMWAEWKTMFEQMHPNSFTEQKKFMINDVRRRFQLKSERIASATTEAKPVSKTGGVKIPPPPKKD